MNRHDPDYPYVPWQAPSRLLYEIAVTGMLLRGYREVQKKGRDALKLGQFVRGRPTSLLLQWKEVPPLNDSE